MEKTNNKLPTPDTNPLDGDKLIEATIPKTKENRLFAPFRNKQHLGEMRDMLYRQIPDELSFELMLFIGQLESTWVEGFSDDNK